MADFVGTTQATGWPSLPNPCLNPVRPAPRQAGSARHPRAARSLRDHTSPNGDEQDAALRGVRDQHSRGAGIPTLTSQRGCLCPESGSAMRGRRRRNRDWFRGIAIARPAPRPARKQSRGSCHDATTGVIEMSPRRTCRDRRPQDESSHAASGCVRGRGFLWPKSSAPAEWSSAASLTIVDQSGSACCRNHYRGVRPDLGP
jgi:hypothetical protein